MLNGELLGGGVLTGQIGREVITISKEEQDVVIEPRREQFDVYPDVGKVIKKATVKAVTSDIDENIVARNIRGGVTILGVTGDLEPDKPDQSKVVEPTKSEQVITADSGYELASVTIKPVTAEIDSDIVAENIRKDTEVLGVVGTMEAREDLDTELAEQESLIAELESGVNELPEKPYDRLQYKCDNIKSLAYEFYVISSSLEKPDITQLMNGVDTSSVEYMNYMFASGTVPCYYYTDLSGININAQNCVSMNSMFRNQNGLKILPIILNADNVTDRSYMFYGCATLEDVRSIAIKGKCYQMFYGCSALKYLPEINIGDLNSCYGMFDGCSSLENIPMTGSTTLVLGERLFYYCSSLIESPNIDTSYQTNFNYWFANCNSLTTANLNMLKANATYNLFLNCYKLTNLTLKNIKMTLQIGSGTSYGTLLTDESIINTFKELWDMTGSTAKTLTLSTPSYERAEAIYVKLVEVTDEMRAEDEYIDNKKPCVVCESTDEGAMTLKEYGISKNWNIAK